MPIDLKWLTYWTSFVFPFFCFQDMNLNTAEFMQLYAWYSWPNVVLCFLGGFLIDRVFGIRYYREPGCSGFVLNPYLASLQWKKWNLLFQCRLDWVLLRILVSIGLEPSSFLYLSVLDRLVCVKLLMWNCHFKFLFSSFNCFVLKPLHR